jgi:hypothetical protein
MQEVFDCQLNVRPLLLACTLYCSTHTVDIALGTLDLYNLYKSGNLSLTTYSNEMK